MNLLRIAAVILAIGLAGGETWRSWGAGRPFIFVIDDFIMAALLIAGAVAVAKDTFARRAFFAAAWGYTAGQLYSSFFSKIVHPDQANAGNWNLDMLTWLLGVAFITSVIGMIASFVLPQAHSPNSGKT